MTRRSPARLLAIAAALAFAVAACATAGPSPTPAAPTASPTAPPTAVPSTPDAGPPTSSPPASAGSGGVVEDASLLGILPATVGGVDVSLEHQAFLDARSSDPGFAQNVRRAAFGVAASGSDLVSGVVAELEPGLFSDGFFRDWRDTYNQGACAQSGGVTGNAEAQIGSRTVYIATCAGGLRTYHAWLPERGTIVSALSLGDQHLGEALMAGLRP